jgi:hypothetical protein
MVLMPLLARPSGSHSRMFPTGRVPAAGSRRPAEEMVKAVSKDWEAWRKTNALRPQPKRAAGK